MDVKKAAKAMSKKLGATINPKHVVKLPNDGCDGHLGMPSWEVYAARAGEFVVILYQFKDGTVNVVIH